jgi:hypothetical protein
MAQHEASRTLVKSPPELWTECSDAGSLARHLGEFGEIRITRLEPETTVAWEGERVSGTVRIEPSGWGTRVTLTAVEEEPEAVVAEPTVAPEPERVPEPERASEPEPMPEPQPAEPAVAAAAPPGRRRLLERMRTLFRPERVTAEVPAPEPEPDPDPEPPAPEPAPEPPAAAPTAESDPEPRAPETPEPEPTPAAPAASKVLAEALESLGQAHHRPFSRT